MAKKMHHAPDYIKNKDADVIKHGSGRAVPNEHWCIDVGESVFAPGKTNDNADAFLAQSGSTRPQPHRKINECDH